MINEQIKKLMNQYSLDGKGDIHKVPSTTVGIVVDTDDPLQMGRLRIFCPALNDDPKKLQHLPWASYMMPFGGAVNNKTYTRGADSDNATTSGAVHYGLWGVAELGAHALVGCIDDDIRRRYWMGCLPEHQELHTLGHGRWDWTSSDGSPDGPLSSNKSPIQPAYENLSKAFNGDKNSAEWKTRAADFQLSMNSDAPSQDKQTHIDNAFSDIQDNELDEWVKKILGEHGYDWTAFKNIALLKHLKVCGIVSPGFHALTMDDRPFNNRIRLRSSGGQQIILDDTNERLYISGLDGSTWIEMDKSGNIDMYAKRRFSVHAEKDINFTTDEAFRVKAKTGIYMYSGDNTEQTNLNDNPVNGEIRIQSANDIHIASGANLRMYSVDDTLFEIGNDWFTTVGNNANIQVQNEFNIITNTGDFNLTVSGNVNELVKGNIKSFSLGETSSIAKGNVEIMSFFGKLDVGAQQNITVKSTSKNIVVEAVGGNSGSSGGIFLKSPGSQATVTKEGVSISTSKKLKIKTSDDIQIEASTPNIELDVPLLKSDSATNFSNLPTPLPIMGVDGITLAARVAYNAGFRGDSLVTAVAIAGAESAYSPNAIGDEALVTSKWGPSLGFWQIRTLTDPDSFGFPDNLRRSPDLFDPQLNANAAFAISRSGTNFKPWSTYVDNKYSAFHAQVEAAVITMGQEFGPMSIPISLPSVSISPSLILSSSGITMQSPTDINMKTLSSGFSTGMFSSLVPSLNNAITGLLDMNALLATTFDSLPGGGVSFVLDLSLVEILSSINIDALIDRIPPFKSPFFSGNIETIFDLESFEVEVGLDLFDVDILGGI